MRDLLEVGIKSARIDVKVLGKLAFWHRWLPCGEPQNGHDEVDIE
jgi:hypothetical protein